MGRLIVASESVSRFHSPFTNALPARTRDDGTGLGLSVVQEIAEAHGWSIAVTESVGGVRFEITGIEIAD